MPRLRPDHDDLIGGVLRAWLPDGATVAAARSNDWASRMPYVSARDIGATGGPDVRNRTTAEFDWQVWAGSRREASDLEDACLAAALHAWRVGLVVAGAGIARITDVRYGAELRTVDQPDGVWRWQGGVTAVIRPVVVAAAP